MRYPEAASSRDPRGRGAAALAAVLPRVVKVEAASDSEALLVGGNEISVVWAGEGSLGDARASLASGSMPDIVAARRLSPGAQEELSRAGVGWVDESGAAEIAIGSIIVSRSGRPDPRAEKPPRWTSAVLAVSEAVLCGRRATVAAMQESTGLSSGSCTNALRVLTELGFLEAKTGRGRGSARRLIDPHSLLIAYARAAKSLQSSLSIQIGVAWQDPIAGLAEVGRRWSEMGIEWAATGVAAANVIAPYLATVSTVEAFVDTDTIIGLEAVAADVGLRPIDGGRLTLRPVPTMAVKQLTTTIEGLRVAPWPRVYVDLIAAGVRGEEAAEHLWETIDAR